MRKPSTRGLLLEVPAALRAVAPVEGLSVYLRRCGAGLMGRPATTQLYSYELAIMNHTLVWIYNSFWYIKPGQRFQYLRIFMRCKIVSKDIDSLRNDSGIRNTWEKKDNNTENIIWLTVIKIKYQDEQKKTQTKAQQHIRTFKKVGKCNMWAYLFLTLYQHSRAQYACEIFDILSFFFIYAVIRAMRMFYEAFLVTCLYCIIW